MKLRLNKKFKRRWIKINRRLFKEIKVCATKKTATQFKTRIIIQF